MSTHRFTSTQTGDRTLPALLVAGLAWGALAGCSDTSIVGSVLDEDVATGGEKIQMALARGSNSEVTDIMTVGTGYKYWVLSGTDDVLNAGIGTTEELASIGNWDDGSMDSQWEQGLEGSWSGLKVVNNAMEAFSADRFQTHPIVARGYLNSAHSERLMGDMFCSMAYGFDHTGGQDLENLGDADFDNGPVGKDSVFQRMATFAELALAQAERAVAAGEPNPANEGVLSDGHFDPERLVIASHGAAAQAYHALASLGVDPGTNWPLAVEHAAQVPTDFVEVTIHDTSVEINELWDITWDNDDVTLYGEEDQSRPEGLAGAPAGVLWPDDPRVQIHDCTMLSGCDDEVSEGEEWPMWVPLKYPDAGADDEMVTGTEMRLIEAEEALVNRQDFATFYDMIDEARAFQGAEPTERINVVGDFEWPNAEDDAMSILDRERYLEMWMEGRRLFDLYRWDHPFITESRGLIPRHDDLLVGTSRRACTPVAEAECRLNPNVANACTGAT